MAKSPKSKKLKITKDLGRFDIDSFTDVPDMEQWIAARRAEGATNIEFENDWDYDDNKSTFLVARIDRFETDAEYDARVIAEREAEVSKDRELFEKLKAKHGW